jgi:hypothetical protein
MLQGCCNCDQSLLLRLADHQMAIKAADLGHLCDPTPTHLRWVAALEEEFFKQGDAEKAQGLPVTPLFDRTKPGVTKSQLAFMDIVAVPLYQAMAKAFPSTQALLEGVRNTKCCKCASIEGCLDVASAPPKSLCKHPLGVRKGWS